MSKFFLYFLTFNVYKYYFILHELCYIHPVLLNLQKGYENQCSHSFKKTFLLVSISD